MVLQQAFALGVIRRPRSRSSQSSEYTPLLVLHSSGIFVQIASPYQIPLRFFLVLENFMIVTSGLGGASDRVVVIGWTGVIGNGRILL